MYWYKISFHKIDLIQRMLRNLLSKTAPLPLPTTLPYLNNPPLKSHQPSLLFKNLGLLPPGPGCAGFPPKVRESPRAPVSSDSMVVTCPCSTSSPPKTSWTSPRCWMGFQWWGWNQTFLIANGKLSYQLTWRWVWCFKIRRCFKLKKKNYKSKWILYSCCCTLPEMMIMMWGPGAGSKFDLVMYNSHQPTWKFMSFQVPFEKRPYIKTSLNVYIYIHTHFVSLYFYLEPH